MTEKQMKIMLESLEATKEGINPNYKSDWPVSEEA